MTETVEKLETQDVESNEVQELESNQDIQKSLETMSLEDLRKKRMGTFKVGISHGDAVYYRNLLNKSDFTGPQQAYLLVVAKTELSQICEALKEKDKNTRYDVELTSAAIESIGFFMNRYVGKGSDSAMKLFTASMLLRPVMGEINKIDEIISSKSKTDTEQ